MKILGQVLLWAGFLSGALATVFHLPAAGVENVKKLTQEQVNEKGLRFTLPELSEVTVPEDGWNLVPWSWYLISVGVSVAGIVLLYMNRAVAGKQSETTKSNLKQIKLNLENLITNIARLIKNQHSMPPSKITEFIDDELADDFREFAEGRDSITAEHDLSVFAEVMTQFAAAERSVNRAWSAAADGYVDEASTCLERAEMLLATAREELRVK